MRIHFYKLHLGGNSFILIDTEQEKELKPSMFSDLSRTICNRRYGVGASGCIFLDEKNNLQVFLPNGNEEIDFYDALFCAARYAFDSGRLTKNNSGELSIIFNTLKGTTSLKVLSAREFEANLGSPFTLASGTVITPQTGNCLETIKLDEQVVKMSGIHIITDNLVTTSKNNYAKSFFNLYVKLREIFSKQKIYLTFVQSITKETLCIRTIKRGTSTSCASAASALVTSVLAGKSSNAAVCIFAHGNKSIIEEQSLLSKDLDNSKKITILWDSKDNSIRAIGSAGYTFEGYLDYSTEK